MVAIISKSSAETVERWEFDVNIVQDEDEVERSGGSKGVEQIQKEIQAIVRQVTASVTFLPALDDDEYTFNVLVYTDHGEQSVPVEWCDTEDHELEGGVEAVSMRNFKTSIHEVGTTVKYRTS